MCLGVPGQVVVLLAHDLARVDVKGNQFEISVKLTPQVREGEYVLIHAGFAVEIIDEGWALETIKVLEELKQYAEL